MDHRQRARRLARVEEARAPRHELRFHPDVWELTEDPDVTLALAEYAVLIDDGADPLVESRGWREVEEAMDRVARRRAGIPEPVDVATHPDPPGPGWLSDGVHWHANMARPASPELERLIRAALPRVLGQ